MIEAIYRFLVRFRHPYSLPEELGIAVGHALPNHLCFEELLGLLQGEDFIPSTLYHNMPRREALKAFQTALKKEFFGNRASLSFQFSCGWIQFDLDFESEKLRRVFLHHPKLPLSDKHEIRLQSNTKSG